MGQRRNQRATKKYLETNENGKTKHQNIWDAAKPVLRGNFTINTYIEKKEIYQINNGILSCFIL